MIWGYLGTEKKLGKKKKKRVYSNASCKIFWSQNSRGSSNDTQALLRKRKIFHALL